MTQIPSFLASDSAPEKSPEQLAAIVRREIADTLKTPGWSHITKFLADAAAAKLVAMRYAKSDFDSRTLFAQHVALTDIASMVTQLALEPQTDDAQ
jgi:hypothetical protein